MLWTVASFLAFTLSVVDITPWKYAKEASFMLCAITAGFYILLAQ